MIKPPGALQWHIRLIHPRRAFAQVRFLTTTGTQDQCSDANFTAELVCEITLNTGQHYGKDMDKNIRTVSPFLSRGMGVYHSFLCVATKDAWLEKLGA